MGLKPDSKARERALAKAAARLEADANRATLERRRDAAVEGALSPDRRDRLESALARVSARRLAWYAPRKSTGVVDPAAALALLRLGDPERRPGTREPWLVARGREEDGRLTFALGVEELISENESHRWEDEPWRWDGADATPPERRWGGDSAALDPALAALDAGRWAEAFDPFGIVLDAAVQRLLDGMDASPELADLTAAWVPRFIAGMARIAPWRIEGATAHLRRGRPMRLFGLGGVAQQRKPGVFLAGDAAAARLVLEFSASNERVPEPAWTRPLDLDLVRAGLVDRAAIPGAEG